MITHWVKTHMNIHTIRGKKKKKSLLGGSVQVSLEVNEEKIKSINLSSSHS
jgi:hypothetical protein